MLLNHNFFLGTIFSVSLVASILKFVNINLRENLTALESNIALREGNCEERYERYVFLLVKIMKAWLVQNQERFLVQNPAEYKVY